MNIRYRTGPLWVILVFWTAYVAASAVDRLRNQPAPMFAVTFGLTGGLWLLAVPWIIRAALRAQQFGIVARIGSLGLELKNGPQTTLLSWPEIRSTPRPKLGEERKSALLAKMRSTIPEAVLFRSPIELQSEDDIPGLLDFYARNPARLSELDDPAALKHRMELLRLRRKRRLRSLQRNLGTLRVRNRVVDRPA